MNRKILMRVTKTIIAAAVGSAFAITMIAGVKIDSSAQGLTQTTDASKVVYSNVSASEIELLKSIFDFDYYKTQNPELVGLLGDNYNALFEHFYKYGLFEGRTCNANFDPAAYASAYSDLKSAFGTDILSYYKHYVTEGKNDPNRQITTLKACADNGITVQAITNPEVKITPQLYRVAEKFGTTNYAAVSNVVERAIVEAAAVGGTAVISNGNESVVLTADDVGSSSSDTSNNESSKADTSNNESSKADTSNNESSKTDTSNNESSKTDESTKDETTNNETIPNASENTDNTEAGDSGNTSPAETPSDSGTDTSGSGDTDNGGSTGGKVIDNYTIVKTISLSNSDSSWPNDGFDILIFKGSSAGYGAWNYTSSWSSESGNVNEYVLKEKTDDYDYDGETTRSDTDDSMGTQIAYIPVYVMDASSSTDTYEEGTPRIITGAEEELSNSFEKEETLGGTAEKVTITDTSDGESYSYDMIIDKSGTTDTAYNVGVSFGEGTNDDQVEVSVAIESEDGEFSLVDDYIIDAESTAEDGE